MDPNTRPSECAKLYADLLRKTTRLLTHTIIERLYASNLDDLTIPNTKPFGRVVNRIIEKNCYVRY